MSLIMSSNIAMVTAFESAKTMLEKPPWANPKEEGDILADPLYLVCVKNYNEFTIVDSIRNFSRSPLNEAKPTSRLESSNISSTSAWTMFSKNCAEDFCCQKKKLTCLLACLYRHWARIFFMSKNNRTSRRLENLHIKTEGFFSHNNKKLGDKIWFLHACEITRSFPFHSILFYFILFWLNRGKKSGRASRLLKIWRGGGGSQKSGRPSGRPSGRESGKVDLGVLKVIHFSTLGVLKVIHFDSDITEKNPV